MNFINVYGFGSFFEGSSAYGDIDLLLVHNERTVESCELAIRCKRELRKKQENLHITMLSKQEEKSFSFLSKCQAKPLGEIQQANESQDIERIISIIRNNNTIRVQLMGSE